MSYFENINKYIFEDIVMWLDKLTWHNEEHDFIDCEYIYAIIDKMSIVRLSITCKRFYHYSKKSAIISNIITNNRKFITWKRIYIPFSITNITDIKHGKSYELESVKKEELRKIMSKIKLHEKFTKVDL